MIEDASVDSQFVLSPAARRALPLAVAVATVAHVAVFTLLLIAPARQLPEPERVTYDLVFVEPEAPPAPVVAPQVVRAIEPPSLAVPTPAPPRPKPRPVAKAPALVSTADDSPAQAGEPAEEATPEPVAPSPAVASAPAAPARAAGDPAYARTLFAWLNRYREYPVQARRHGVEGRVVLFVVIERSGKVSQLEVATSSGAEILDQAALSMMRRADPVPPVPASMAGDLIQFWVPIDFGLSR